MNKLPLLLTRMNLRIVTLIAEGEFPLREVAEKLACSPGKVHQAAQLFKAAGLVSTERVKNRLIIKPERNSPLYKKIKSLTNIHRFMGTKSYKSLKSVGLIGIYGSYSQGTDDKESDIDLVILTEKKELHVRELIRDLEEELDKRINPLILSPQKIKKMEKDDKEFHTRLKLTTLELNGDMFG